MTLDDFRYWLTVAGFREYREAHEKNGVGWAMYRDLDTKPCQSNGRPPQLKVSPYRLVGSSHVYESADVGIRAAVHGDVWLDFRIYGLSFADTVAQLAAIETVLRRSWESALAASTPLQPSTD